MESMPARALYDEDIDVGYYLLQQANYRNPRARALRVNNNESGINSDIHKNNARTHRETE